MQQETASAQGRLVGFESQPRRFYNLPIRKKATMSSADDKGSSSKPFTYPKVLLDRNHEVSYSPISGWWFVSIIGSDKTFTASAKTLKEAASNAIAKAEISE